MTKTFRLQRMLCKMFGVPELKFGGIYGIGEERTMTKEILLTSIKENPDAEILFMCGEDSYLEYYAYTAHFLEDVGVCVEYLAFYNDKYYEDKEELQEQIEYDSAKYEDLLPAKEFEKFIEDEVKKCPFKKYVVIRIG